jgi:hypothetical protein
VSGQKFCRRSVHSLKLHFGRRRFVFVSFRNGFCRIIVILQTVVFLADDRVFVGLQNNVEAKIPIFLWDLRNWRKKRPLS